MQDIIQAALPNAKVETKGKDVVVKSKDREGAKKELEAYLNSKKIKFTSVFKSSKSNSLEVLTIPDLGGDVIFKPIIVKGAGGVSFEKELATDLEKYFNGADIKQLKHQDVVTDLSNLFKWYKTDVSKYAVVHEGAKNQKRNLMFSGTGFTVTNNSGETLTDITLLDKKTKKKEFLSLKMSKSYYTLSASIGKYFADKSTQIKVNDYFGFDGVKQIGFGKEYVCVNNKPNYSKVKQNLTNLLQQAIGKDVILVHKRKENDVITKPLKQDSSVLIEGTLSENNYVYPEPGVRKYANIKVNAVIGGYSYVVHFQFRGTTAADKGPKYLRILLESK